MNTIRQSLLSLALLLSMSGVAQPIRMQVGPQAMPETVAPISAPFKMPQLQRPVFPQLSTTVKMPRKGLSTKAIQKAIDALAAKGGGTIIIPTGEWQTAFGGPPIRWRKRQRGISPENHCAHPLY